MAIHDNPTSVPSLGEQFARQARAVEASTTLPPLSGDEAPSSAAGMPGVERLRANLEGRIPPPPTWYTLGYRLASVEVGRVSFEFQPLPAHTNYAGTVHGGVLTALADSAMGCAVLSVLPGHHWCGTVEVRLNVLRPARVPGPVLRCVGTVRWRGSTLALAEASIDAGGTEIAVGSSTYAIRRDRALSGEPVRTGSP